MINFIKSLLPNTLFLIGSIIGFLGNFLSTVSKFIQEVSILLHMALNTKLGKQMTDIQKRVSNILIMHSDHNKAKQIKADLSKKEDNKLAEIVKPTLNLVTTEKKNDDNSKS